MSEIAATASMANGGEDPPAPLRSQVWQNFSFPVSYNSTGERVVEKTRTVHRRCSAVVRYVSGNTSNQGSQVSRIHLDKHAFQSVQTPHFVFLTLRSRR